MQILEVLPSNELGGVQVNVATRLRLETEHETSVLFESCQLDNTISFPQSRKIYSGPALNPWQLRRGLRQIPNQSRPDVIVGHSSRAIINLAVLKVLGQLPAPFVGVSHRAALSPRFPKFVRSLYMRLLNWANGRSAGLIAVSSVVARSRLCSGAKEVIIHHLGAQRPALCSHQTTDRFVLLSVGRFTPEKNFPALVSIARAAARKANVPTTLRIHGYGDIAHAPRDDGQIDPLFRLEIIDDKTANPWCCVDGYVVASTQEGGPLTLYEALLVGLPVASTPVGAAPEILKTDERSVCSAGIDAISLCRAVHAILKQGKLSRDERASRCLHFGYLEIESTQSHYYASLQRLLGKIDFLGN